MTAHKIDSKSVKSKIILPIKPSTKVLPKNKKITISLNKMREITTHFYNKIQIKTISTSSKLQYRPTNQYKVHSMLVKTLNKV